MPESQSIPLTSSPPAEQRAPLPRPDAAYRPVTPVLQRFYAANDRLRDLLCELEHARKEYETALDYVQGETSSILDVVRRALTAG